MNEALAKGNNVAWHRIIMAAVIGFIGILACAMFFAQYLLDRQQEELSKPYRFLQISDDEASKLPSGDYMICGAFRTGMESPDMIWLLCRKNGGIIVAAKMPEGTEKPVRPPVSLTIDNDGAWKFSYPQSSMFTPPKIENNTENAKNDG